MKGRWEKKGGRDVDNLIQGEGKVARKGKKGGWEGEAESSVGNRRRGGMVGRDDKKGWWEDNVGREKRDEMVGKDCG
jgi:hypothetical protein